jgi:hypothetical protein
LSNKKICLSLKNICWVGQQKKICDSILITFSFSSTSADASAGTEGQTAGLGQGSKLREALFERVKNYQTRRMKTTAM